VIDYYPYGSERIASGSFSEQRKFIGEELDQETDFSYLNARYYDGSRGQFMSQDPAFQNLSRLDTQLIDPQTWNSYSYARNTPLVLVDNGGEFAFIPAAFLVYGAAMLAIDIYDANTVLYKYPDQFSDFEKDVARTRVLLGATTLYLGASKFLTDAEKIALDATELTLDISEADFISIPSTIKSAVGADKTVLSSPAARGVSNSTSPALVSSGITTFPNYASSYNSSVPIFSPKSPPSLQNDQQKAMAESAARQLGYASVAEMKRALAL
jgi:RHS repeat-associated protein